MSVLVVGIGNTLRGDDGAGAEAAQQLHAAWRRACLAHQLLLVHQLVPEIAMDVVAPGVTSVLFVDASVEQEPGGDAAATYRLARVETDANVETYGRAGPIAHHVSPQTVMTYAALFSGQTPNAWILALPAVQFEYGSQFSTPTGIAVSRLVQDSMRIWESICCTSVS